MLSFTGHALRWLTFLGRLQQPTARRAYADEVAQFADYSLRERGLSLQTIDNCTRTLHEFLGEVDRLGLRLSTLTVAQVDELLGKKVRDEGYARTTIRRWGSVLRPFFEFAERRGWCRPGLAAAIMAPRVYRHAGLPVGPSCDDVKRLLAAAKGDRPTDLRDRALLMLLTVYGLRAGEVVALRLEDFDWKREVLNVPHGTGQIGTCLISFEHSACPFFPKPTATYLYGKKGAGFASILDKQGHDWVSYRPGDKARGEFRGRGRVTPRPARARSSRGISCFDCTDGPAARPPGGYRSRSSCVPFALTKCRPLERKKSLQVMVACARKW
ncbi:MAG TPA: tyrosine-type recombinase/integrase [Gemmataceae bacterium]|jgi:hypothetical protein|nr:tyrosine-type recombinase/integrase [Gemmataceae bacterium]